MRRPITAGLIVGTPELREQIASAIQAAGGAIAFSLATADAMQPSGAAAPDVLVLDFGQAEAHAVMAQLKTVDNPPAVIGAHVEGDPGIILHALRAGAREFLYPPVNENALRQALEKIAAERAHRNLRRQEGKVVAFVSASGGCGATMCACHAAAELRRIADAPTLVADLDLAAGTAGFWMRATPSYSVLDAARNLSRLDHSFWTAVVAQVQPKLDVLCAPQEIPLSDVPPPSAFAEVLQFARETYAWTLADFGAGLCPATMAALSAADSMFVVSTAEVTALYHARRIVRAVLDSGYGREKLSLVLSRTRKNQALTREEIERIIGVPAPVALPEDCDEIANAHAEGRMVSARSELGRRMLSLASRIAGKGTEPRPSKFALLRFRAQEA